MDSKHVSHDGSFVPVLGEDSLLHVAPRIPPPLDPGFRPFVLGSRNYMKATERLATTDFHFAVERHRGLTCRFVVPCFDEGHGFFTDSCFYIERKIKFILWQRGGCKLYICGNAKLCKFLAASYSAAGARAFDVELMSRAYKVPFQTIVCASSSDLPEAMEDSLTLGGNMNGNRIGFDLGGSSLKLAAVQEGKAVFTKILHWDPCNEPDPEVHWETLNSGIQMVMEKLDGKVDAIGGGSAGIVVDNELRVSSLFRSVPPERFDTECAPIMKRLSDKWSVPVMCVNDGDVSALAGGLLLGKRALLGLSMGTSEAAGYLNPTGNVTSWLNELAFAPVDMSTSVVNKDEWSGDVGVGVMYLSKEALAKLAPAAGYTFSADMDLTSRLSHIIAAHERGDAGAALIYESVGCYLGYSIASYAEFYVGLENVFMMGGVTSGCGGDLIIRKAREVLANEFPELAITLHSPDNELKQVGQAVAGASL
jgi:predicted NBD/HSP70 family sugar kinase